MRTAPLIDDNAQDNFNSLQNKFLEFIRYYDDITEYERKLANFTRKDYDRVKDDIHRKIQSMPEILKNINEISSTLRETQYQDLALKSKSGEQIRIIDEKIRPKREELSNLINRIVEKENRVAKKLSGVNPEDVFSATQTMNSFNSNNDRNDSLIRTETKRDSFLDSKLVIQDVQNNQEYLKKRQDALEEIKKISSQVKDITIAMHTEVEKQGENLKSIDSNIEISKTNAIKAEFEISVAEKETRATSNKVCCIAFLVVFILASILGILLFIFLGNKNGTTSSATTALI